MGTILQVSQLVFSWPGQSPVLDIESLALESGEKLFIAGSSGSGKSTLLSLVSGVVLPVQGDIQLLDRPITASGSAARDHFRADHIGFIFQQFNLIPYLSVIENVSLPCEFSQARRERALQKSGTLQAEAMRLLRALDLADTLFDHCVTALSVGEQQRVAVARALMGSPELVMADEPTSALDEDTRQHFIDLLFAECAAQGSSLIFVSHDQTLMVHFDRQILMHDINRAALGRH